MDRPRLLLPKFELADFTAGLSVLSNPYLRSVVRIPRTATEQAIAVGVVSNTYTLVQHEEVAEKCFDGLRRAGVDVSTLRCELGLTPLGEWMNLRVYFPDTYRPGREAKTKRMTWPVLVTGYVGSHGGQYVQHPDGRTQERTFGRT